MNHNPNVGTDDYLAALALARATLRSDEAGVYAIIDSCDVAMTFQAMTNLFLMVSFTVTGKQGAAAVDTYLEHMLRDLPAEVEKQQR